MRMLDTRPTLILTAALMVVVGCERGPSKQSAPTTQAVDASLAGPVEQVPLADQVRLEYVGEEWDAYGNFLPVLRLANHSQRDISYTGYSTSSPAYVLQERGSDREGWREQNPGWCGTGLGRQQLRAGQATTFTVVPPEGAQSWRIGIETSSPGTHVMWTQPITARAGMAREAPSAAELVQTNVSKHPGRDFPYTFTLKNVSNGPLFYGGFNERHVPPLYLNQEQRSGGWHDEGHALWNGSGSSGFGFKELPPGGSISFSIPAQSLDSTWRIGVRLFKTDRPVSHSDAYSPVWWEPLPPRNKASVTATRPRHNPPLHWTAAAGRLL